MRKFLIGLCLGLAASAAGADGVMVEIHPSPERALSDARQAIVPEEFARLVPELFAIRDVLQRTALPASP